MLRVIVLNYKRPENMVHFIRSFKKVCPLSIVNNNPEEQFPYLGQPIDVINNTKNYFCMERWVRCFDYDEEYKLLVDDDLLPHPSLINKMMSLNVPIVGVYGKSGVDNAKKYSDLKDHWCEDNSVDFLVGSVILVKQSALNLIEDEIFKVGYPERGDDIIISYLLKRKLGLKQLPTTSGKVLNLPEGNVGLNKDPTHFSKRWKVVEKFKNLTW